MKTLFNKITKKQGKGQISISPMHLQEVIEAKPRKFQKIEDSLVPTSQILKQFNLISGRNDLTFTICNGAFIETRLYLWEHDDRIIISDIDGTITKSDVRGQLLPMLGIGHIHEGVATFFTQLETKGFKILYLTARSIGQSRYTKRFIQEICEED
jgi:phosphatidate phosphatase LPIN